jgi:Ca2+-binding EF-hand superfamily protein
MRAYLTTAAAAALFVSGWQALAQQQDRETVTGESICEQPWAQVDADNDGTVNQEEASAAIEAHFDAIDTDDSGTINEAEWVYCMSPTTEMQAAEADRSQESFEITDADKDSAVTREEFQERSRQAFEESQAQSSDQNNALILRRYVLLMPNEAGDARTVEDMSADEAAGRSAATFNALDQDGNDQLSSEEWSERTPEVGMNREKAQQQFSELDQDTSGSISQEEFTSGQTAKLDQAKSQVEQAEAQSDQATSQTEQAQAQTGSDNGQEGIPVFIYRFLTF